MATKARSSRKQPDPLADLDARGYVPSRKCETDVWLRRVPAAAPYLDTLVALHKRGDRRATYPAIVALLRERFGYTLTESAIGKHVRRCCRE